MSQGKVNPLADALQSEPRVKILKYLGRERPGKEICAREISEIQGWKLEFASYHLMRLHERGAVKLVSAPGTDPTGRYYVFDIEEPWALALLGLEEPGTRSDETDGTASP